jgi:hypothetical protein
MKQAHIAKPEAQLQKSGVLNPMASRQERTVQDACNGRKKIAGSFHGAGAPRS